MSASDYKISVFKEIMDIDDELALKQIYQMVHQFILGFKEISGNTTNPGKLEFEEWNGQFVDERDLDEFIPEYGMTLREFRLSIYKTEMDDNEMTMQEFKKSIKTWL